MTYKLLFILLVANIINVVMGDSSSFPDSLTLGNIMDHVDKDFDQAKDCYQQVENAYAQAIKDLKNQVSELPSQIMNMLSPGEKAQSNMKEIAGHIYTFHTNLKLHFHNKDKTKTKENIAEFKRKVMELYNEYLKHKKVHEEIYHNSNNGNCDFDCLPKETFDEINKMYEKCNIENTLGTLGVVNNQNNNINPDNIVFTNDDDSDNDIFPNNGGSIDDNSIDNHINPNNHNSNNNMFPSNGISTYEKYVMNHPQSNNQNSDNDFP